MESYSKTVINIDKNNNKHPETKWFQRHSPQELQEYEVAQAKKDLVCVGREFAPGKYSVAWVDKSQAGGVLDVVKGVTVYRWRNE